MNLYPEMEWVLEEYIQEKYCNLKNFYLRKLFRVEMHLDKSKEWVS